MTRFVKEIDLGGKKFKIIDLTEPLREDIEVYPGEPKPSKEIVTDIRKAGFQYNVYRLGEHNFHPHADAPNHQNPELQHLGMEVYGLDYSFNNAIMIDLSEKVDAIKVNNIKYLLKIEKRHIQPFAELIKARKALIIRTGYDIWIESNKPHQPEGLPHLSFEAAEFISSFENLKVFGIDSITIDPVGVRLAHRALKRIMIVESLVHLYEIPESSRKEFDLQTSAIRIIGATGGPVLAYAYVTL